MPDSPSPDRAVSEEMVEAAAAVIASEWMEDAFTVARHALEAARGADPERARLVEENEHLRKSIRNSDRDILAEENERLTARLNMFNESVRVYVGHRECGYEVRPGWLEEEITATDDLLAALASQPSPEEGGEWMDATRIDMRPFRDDEVNAAWGEVRKARADLDRYRALVERLADQLDKFAGYAETVMINAAGPHRRAWRGRRDWAAGLASEARSLLAQSACDNEEES